MSKTLTHEEYLQKLQDKNIKVIPLEEYKGTRIKMLHKCICGNEWNVMPQGVLQNNYCGCQALNSAGNKPRTTHNEYIQKLKDKNIETVPLEPYITSFQKILHRCTCGNTWLARPSNVLHHDMGCGCKNIRTILNRYKNKQTTLYYIKINGLYKIGLTTRNLKYRYSRDKNIDITILREQVFQDGRKAYLIEQTILKMYKEYQYCGENILTGGNSELFTKDVLNLDRLS